MYTTGKGICEWCGREFVKNSPTHVYCSKECIQNAKKETDKFVEDVIFQSSDSKGWKECEFCGRYFKLDHCRSKAIYCSSECREAARRKHDYARKYERRMKGIKLPKPKDEPPQKKTDGFTWDDIRGVFKEYGTSSYHKALEILEQRRKEANENDLQR